jgi:hypothetical protein
MKHRVLFLITLAFLAAPAPAGAASYTGDGAAHMRGVASVMPGPAGALEVRMGVCPGASRAAGCWIRELGLIYLLDENPITAMHEMGHAFDTRNLDDGERAVLAPVLLKGATDATWSRCGVVNTPDYGLRENKCPTELFGEAYAACALKALPERVELFRTRRGTVGGRGRAATSTWPFAYGYMPSLKQHRRVCALIRAFASPAV